MLKEFGEKTGMPYISHRWLGGMLTNWKTIKCQSTNFWNLKKINHQDNLVE